MLNNIIIMGRLVRDPELKTVNDQTVANFTIACDREGGRDAQADFVDCAAWRGTAEVVKKYCVKGDLVIVTGRLQSRKWEDRDGNKRTAWEISTFRVDFPGGNRRKEEAAPAGKEDELPF